MSTLTQLIEKGKTEPIDAGIELCQLLMYPPNDNQGYTLGSALLAAREQLDLSVEHMAIVAEKVVAAGPVEHLTSWNVTFPVKVLVTVATRDGFYQAQMLAETVFREKLLPVLTGLEDEFNVEIYPATRDEITVTPVLDD